MKRLTKSRRSEPINEPVEKTMVRPAFFATCCAAALLFVIPNQAAAHARGVGLGVAVGGSYSPTDIADDPTKASRTPGSSLAWGFFVDIPLLETFYISPAAMLYELDLGTGKRPVTDTDLSFKFIIPLGDLAIGAGFTVGITNAEADYAGHYGGIASLALKLVPNFGVFAMMQYKKLLRDEKTDIDNLHGFVGGMFYF